MSKSSEQKKLEAIEALHEKQVQDAYAWLLDDPRGRLILWDILDFTQVNNHAFHGNSMDALRIGQKQVGSHVLARVYEMDERGDEIEFLMRKEARQRHKQLEAAIEKADKENEVSEPEE